AITQIPLTLRLNKGYSVYYEELDSNFSNLRDAILSLAAEHNANRLVFGPMPAPDERDGAVWLPFGDSTYPDLAGFFVWNESGNRWQRIAEPVLWNTTTGTSTEYKLTLPDY